MRGTIGSKTESLLAFAMCVNPQTDALRVIDNHIWTEGKEIDRLKCCLAPANNAVRNTRIKLTQERLPERVIE